MYILTYTKVKQVEGTFRLNIISMIQLAKEAEPYLRRGSAIINTTSVTAYKASLNPFCISVLLKDNVGISCSHRLLVHERSHRFFYEGLG